jgi:hypothetical protein
MKHIIRLLIATIIVSSLSLPAFAQPPKKWVPENGYWVVESNRNTPQNATVFFYNLKGDMIYKEKIEGVRVNCNRRKTAKKLNAVLQQSLLAWEKNWVVKENERLLASRLQ